MKYLNSYNESLQIVEQLRKIIEDTKAKIDDCLLLLSDDYDVQCDLKPIVRPSSSSFERSYYIYSIHITNYDNLSSFVNDLESCLFRINNELNADYTIQFVKEGHTNGKSYTIYMNSVHRNDISLNKFIKSDDDLSSDINKTRVIFNYFDDIIVKAKGKYKPEYIEVAILIS